MKGRDKREIPKKTRRPAASSGTTYNIVHHTTNMCLPGAVRVAYSPGHGLATLHTSFAFYTETRSACSPPTKENRVQPPAGSLDFRKWDSCRTIPLAGGFSRGSPAPSFRRRSIITSTALIGSEDLDRRCRPWRRPARTTRERGESRRLQCVLRGVCACDAQTAWRLRVRSSQATHPPSLPSAAMADVFYSGHLRAQHLCSPQHDNWMPGAVPEESTISCWCRSLQASWHSCTPSANYPPLLTCTYTVVDISIAITFARVRDKETEARPLRVHEENMRSRRRPRGFKTNCAGVEIWLESQHLVLASALASHLGNPGPIPGGFAPGFSHVGIVLDDAACRRIFSGYSRLPRPCIPVLLHHRVSFHVMFRDDGHLRVSAGKSVTRRALLYATPLDDESTLCNRIVAGRETIRNFPKIRQRIWVSRQRQVDACVRADGRHFEHFLQCRRSAFTRV
ncbi:hypothetical protein PR048_027665 [Dryococelus australis]|uniref:Uncharacterized protein n=1 Tax=Dryococelus australis TaxID=614101 RepID=A0ABQ9GH49_9NEOP|nr:hypothetical protein PR048_027665 [Dryococelus australis]